MAVQNGISTSKSSTRYSVKMNPGASFDVTCAPFATASSALLGQSWAHVSYTAECQEIKIDLGGGRVVSGVQEYLIGQMMSAEPDIPYGLTPSGESWAISDGDPFGGWVGTSSSAAAPDPIDDDEPTLYGFFKLPDVQPLITLDVDLDVPSGACPTGGLSISLEQECETKKPILMTIDVHTRNNNAAGMATADYENPTSVTNSIASDGVHLTWMPAPSALTFVGLDYVQFGTALNFLIPPDVSVVSRDPSVGIRWDVELTTGSGWWLGDGSWFFVQRMVPHRAVGRNSPAQVWNMVENDGQYLDGSFPYDGSFPADGSHGTNVDAPSFDVYAPVDYIICDDSFETWLMYLPPGVFCVPVPIRKWTWFWEGRADKGSPWTLHTGSGDSGWDWDGGYFPDFPTWTQAFPGAHWPSGTP
jgi:hypothetical protein